MEHFKYPAIRGQIFPNSQTIYDGQQFTPQEDMNAKQLLVPGGDNLKRPIPAPKVTLNQRLTSASLEKIKISLVGE
ncbi:hypothetical protein T03_10199 [Trichinella britovi]|uniref:Uncharacterized protein n=1 Tax=Trichinella britovi TaxID=45882 RepID=A0A0V1C4N4_TRIBR|nr:hypothetical protein T03_11013 [Trichinella britovi]KRY45400.1 hypothetical protein T03_10199 [Trichinella britovi]